MHFVFYCFFITMTFIELTFSPYGIYFIILAVLFIVFYCPILAFLVNFIFHISHFNTWKYLCTSASNWKIIRDGEAERLAARWERVKHLKKRRTRFFLDFLIDFFDFFLHFFQQNVRDLFGALPLAFHIKFWSVIGLMLRSPL